MADALKVLGQIVPAVTTLTTLYTVPAATQVTVSSIFICNQNVSAAARFRVAIAPAAAADNPRQYLYYDLLLAARNTFVATTGLSLGAGDVVRVYSDVAAVSFNLFGVEVT